MSGIRSGAPGGLGALALGAAAVLALGGARSAPASPKLTVGTTFTIHVVDDMKLTLRFHGNAEGAQKESTDHLAETERIKVLAMAHGEPTKIGISYHDLDSPGGGHMLDQRLLGRQFVVALGKQPRDLPQVTENGVKITGKVGRRVRTDALNVINPPPLEAILRRAMRHPGRRIRVPVKLLEHFIGKTKGVRLLSSTLQLERVSHGRGHLVSRTHQHGHQGAGVVDIRQVSDDLVDLHTGLTLSSKGKARLESHGRALTTFGLVPATQRGVATETRTYHYPAAKADPGAVPKHPKGS